MHPERGFSLLELLVAAAVLAIALLSFGLLTVRALEDAGSLRDDALAEMLLDDMRARADLMGHARLESAFAGGGMEGTELEGWRTQLAALLPGGNGGLCRSDLHPFPASPPASCDGPGPWSVWLGWQRLPATEPQFRKAFLGP